MFRLSASFILCVEGKMLWRHFASPHVEQSVCTSSRAVLFNLLPVNLIKVQFGVSASHCCRSSHTECQSNRVSETSTREASGFPFVLSNAFIISQSSKSSSVCSVCSYVYVKTSEKPITCRCDRFVAVK